MSERVFLPFRGLRSLALALDVDDEAGTLSLFGELDDPEAAREMEIVLTSLVVPNLRRVLERRLGATLDVDGKLEVRTLGSTTEISLRLGASEIEALVHPR